MKNIVFKKMLLITIMGTGLILGGILSGLSMGCGSEGVGEDSPVVIQQLATGNSFTCVLLSDQTVKCWGYNAYGQLGNGTHASLSAPTTAISGLTGVTSIVSGSSHVCALLSDGTVKCWGSNNSGELGDGTNVDKNSPTMIASLTGVTSIVSGASHVCALLSDQTVKCWGYNYSGELGDGTTTDKNVPTLVSGLSGVTSIVAGDYHTCAILSGGTVKCWGYNTYGQLGDGTTTDVHVPPSSSISGLSGVTSLAAGSSHTCALLSDQTVKCWGWAGLGELGRGDDFFIETPGNVLGL